MGFWDKLKTMMGGEGEPPDATPPDAALARRVEAIVVRRMTKKEPFEAIVVADEAVADPAERTVKGIAAACAVVLRLHDEGRFTALGYVRTKLTDGNWLYHPRGYDVAAYGAALSAVPSPGLLRSPTAPLPRRPPPARRSGAASAAAPARAPAAAKPRVNPYAAADGILGLSAAELRKRALRINPYRTASIGRVDTIPPQSDERTAIIDRGLILRGLLSEAQIVEIHRVGDLWLRHHEAAKMAAVVATGAADRAVANLARERAAKKAEKKRASAERARLRAEEILRRKRDDIVYLGVGVSRALADRRAHVEELTRRGLPVLAEPADVARAMGIPVAELRWLCFHAEATDEPHYAYFEIPKRSGGKRLLAAPQPRLARAQAWVLHEVLEKLATEAPAHGFIKGRSTLSCAIPTSARRWSSTSTSPTSFPPSPSGVCAASSAGSAIHLRSPPSSRSSAPSRRAPSSSSRASAPGPPSAPRAAAGRLHQPRALQPGGEEARPAPPRHERQARLHVHALRRRPTFSRDRSAVPPRTSPCCSRGCGTSSPKRASSSTPRRAASSAPPAARR